MLKKILVVSTCDLATLAGNDMHEGISLLQTVSRAALTVSGAALIDGSVAHVLVPSTFGRMKLLAWAASRTARPGTTPLPWISAEGGAPSDTLSQSISPGILRI
jgi:hypothetical protein